MLRRFPTWRAWCQDAQCFKPFRHSDSDRIKSAQERLNDDVASGWVQLYLNA